MKKKGEISVFLALMLSVISAFILTLARSVRIYIQKSEAVYAVDNALRSCFAEYNRELFDRFHVFLIDSSYRGYENGEDMIISHLKTYLENSMTENEVLGIEVEGHESEDELRRHLYDSAVKYSLTEMGQEEDCFVSYLLEVLGNDEIPVQGSCRRGEMEYLLYGLEDDEENIMWAHLDHNESDEVSYEDYLCSRFREEDETILLERFEGLITEYMHENDSPGFEIRECRSALSVAVYVKGRSGEEYTVRRRYSYEI